MKDSHFFLRPNIIVTKGANRCLVIDFAKISYQFAPNTLADFIEKHNKLKVGDIISSYESEEKDIAVEYIEWMLSVDIAFLSINQNFVRSIKDWSDKWDSPYSICNCILEISIESYKDTFRIIDTLSSNRVPYLEIRIFESFPFCKLYDLLLKIQDSDIKALVLIIKYTDELNITNIRKKLRLLTVIENIIIHSAKNDKSVSIHNGITSVTYRSEKLSNICCGRFNTNLFTPNSEFYNESQKYNTCLNRKIAIDQNGEIKNCPSMTKSYGNIKTTTLEEVINKKAFKDLWNIAKDQISICQDCEFRHICTDCRAYLQDPKDIYSKPLKCGYDPYTNKWEEWSTNPLSKAAIKHYELQEIITKS